MENIAGKSFDEIQIQKALMDAPWMACECGGMLFNEVTLFKRLSSLLSPTGNTEHIPAKAVICTKCQAIPKWFADLVPELPKEVISTCTKESK